MSQSEGALRAALAQLPLPEVQELIAEARAEARARAKALLAEAFTEALINQAQQQLSKPPQPTPSEPTSLRYVYGIVRNTDAAAAAGLNGLHGEPTAALTEGELAAIISDVPASDFEESNLRAHLSDMAWVEAVARAHEDVLDQLCEQATTIPLRVCTVYRSDAAVRQMLAREQRVLTAALEQLDGKRELGVQAFATRQPPPADPPASSGADYLRRQRAQRDRRNSAGTELDAAVAEIHERLSAHACDSRVNPPQRPEASGRKQEMVLNGVYLVRASEQPAFEQLVHELEAGSGLELAITGPWPPYNFVPSSLGVSA